MDIIPKSFNRHSELPLYAQVADVLQVLMGTGKIAPGAQLPSVNGLTAELDVSRNTVIEAFRELCRRGLVVARHGKGYFAMSAETKPTVDVVVPIHSNYHLQIYVGLIAGAQDAAERHKERVNIHDHHDSEEEFGRILREIVVRRSNPRLIMVPPGTPNGRITRRSQEAISTNITSRNHRVTVVDRHTLDGFVNINQDKLQGHKLLVARASATGARRIVVFNAGKHDNAIRKWLEEKSIDANLSFPDSMGIDEDIKHCLSIGAEAVLCVNDLHARRILNATNNKPGFKLAGYDGTSLGTAFPPRITTVNSNLLAAGVLAYNLISSTQPPKPKTHQIQPFLIEGDTMGNL